jgi:hypothetical protein
MIQKTKDGYILDDGTQVMFLNREQEKRFNREQYELHLKREYNTFLEKENTSHSLYGINALQEWGAWTQKWELMPITFSTYKEALEYLKNNNMLDSLAYHIVPVEYTLQLSIK